MRQSDTYNFLWGEAFNWQCGLAVVRSSVKTVQKIRMCGMACLVGLLAVACVPEQQSLRHSGDWGQLVAGTNTSMVVGRIEWLEKGVPKNNESGLLAFSIAPQLLRLEDRKRIAGELQASGEFVWQLQPGTYVINRINYRDPWSGNYFFVPRVAFRIENPGTAYYVGTLRVDFSPERDLIGGMSGTAFFTIEDDYAVAEAKSLADFRSRTVEKHLMIRDERLPTTIDTTAEFNLAIQIINALLLGR